MISIPMKIQMHKYQGSNPSIPNAMLISKFPIANGWSKLIDAPITS
jgi:hypothetical protein